MLLSKAVYNKYICHKRVGTKLCYEGVEVKSEEMSLESFAEDGE